MTTKPALFAADYPLTYEGPTEPGFLMYGDWLRIVRDLPHGTTTEDGTTFIGNWVECEVYPYDDRIRIPRSWLTVRKS